MTETIFTTGQTPRRCTNINSLRSLASVSDNNSPYPLIGRPPTARCTDSLTPLGISDTEQLPAGGPNDGEPLHYRFANYPPNGKLPTADCTDSLTPLGILPSVQLSVGAPKYREPLHYRFANYPTNGKLPTVNCTCSLTPLGMLPTGQLSVGAPNAHETSGLNRWLVS